MSNTPSPLDALRIDRSSQAPPRQSSGTLRALIILLLLGAAGGGAWGWWSKNKGAEVDTAVAKESVAQSGSSATQDKTLLNASGYVTARREATVSSKVTGKVMEVLVEEGMKVDAGQIVARLDSSNVEAGLLLAEAQLESARRAAAETEPVLAYARRELERYVRMKDTKAASAADLSKAQSEVGMQEARAARQAAEIIVAEREVAQWKQQVEDTIIRSLFAGVVTTKDSQPGEIISPMSAGGGFTRTGICTVVDMASLEIEVDVNESLINRVSAGQPATAVLDAWPDFRIPAKVIAIIPTADRQKATVKVRVGFEKPDPRILPQMGVKVAFLAAKTEPAPTPASGAPARVVTVPAAAVADSSGLSIVWVVKGGKAERRAVTASPAAVTGADTTVTAGVNAGETVILNPPPTLKDGAAVTIRKP